MAIDILLTLFLVLLNGFFVAAEFAIVKVRASQLETREGISGRLSSGARHIVTHLDSYLAATQLGITIASLGLGWVGEDVVTALVLKIFDALNLTISVETAHNIALPVAFVLITVLHIVFGELAPKSLAIRYPARTTFAVALPLRVFYFLFRPFIWLLNGFANTLLRMIGIKPIHNADIHSEEELKIIIQESAKGGEIQQIEQNIVERAFALGDIKVADLMTHRTDLIWLDIGDTQSVIKQKISVEPHSIYLVARDTLDNLVGAVSIKEIFVAHFESSEFSLEKFVRKPLIVHDGTAAYTLLEKFRQSKWHFAVVVDEYGSVQGVITIDDVLDALVGDISELDKDEYRIIKRDDNSWLADGQFPYFELLNYFGIADKDKNKEFTTIAGLILHLAGRIPAVGDKVEWNEYDLEIVDMDGMRIDKILIARKP